MFDSYRRAILATLELAQAQSERVLSEMRQARHNEEVQWQRWSDNRLAVRNEYERITASTIKAIEALKAATKELGGNA